jgi:hypothetical protein
MDKNAKTSRKFPKLAKIFTLLTIFSLLISIISALPASAAGYHQPDDAKNYSYELEEDGTILITAYRGKENDLYIPEQIDGYTVTAIKGLAFFANRTLTSVTIPDTVVEIGDSAFYSCSKLTNVVLGNGVKSLGNTAFGQCSKLKSVVLGESLESINSMVFSKCTSLKTLIIPNNITTLALWSFQYSGITSVIVPESVTNINSKAFLGSSPAIYGVPGSYAQTFAEKAKLDFTPIDTLLYGDMDSSGDLNVTDLVMMTKFLCGAGNDVYVPEDAPSDEVVSDGTSSDGIAVEEEQVPPTMLKIFEQMTPIQQYVADISSDGKLNVFDIAVLKKRLLETAVAITA